jgi:hypothetical protein
MNPGGVRVDLVAGDVSVAQVYELQPFANTLMTMDLTGAELLKALDDMTDFCITTYNKTPETAYVYLAGAKMTLLVNAAKGSRVTDVQVKAKDGSWKPLDMAATYKVVVNNFMGYRRRQELHARRPPRFPQVRHRLHRFRGHARVRDRQDPQELRRRARQERPLARRSFSQSPKARASRGLSFFVPSSPKAPLPQPEAGPARTP